MGHMNRSKTVNATQNENTKLDLRTFNGFTWLCWSSLIKNPPYLILSYPQSYLIFIFQAGDADTNGAVAGALLGCKIGFRHLPKTWLKGLKHKDWLDDMLNR